MIRRAVVLATLVLVVGGSVALARTLTGRGRDAGPGASSGEVLVDVDAASGRTTGDAAGDDATGVTGGGNEVGGDDRATGGSAVGSTTAPGPPATTVPAPRVPSPSDPARILLVGDSQAQGLEPFIERVLTADDLRPLTTLTAFGKNSSGLVRPDFFDWPAKLRELVGTVDPDIVVMFIGGNETQQFLDMPGKPIDSPEWRAEYGRRVDEVADIMAADGTTLLWVGVPMPGDEWQRTRLAVQNEVVREHIDARSDAVFVDTWTLFSGIDGSYAAFVLDPVSGTYRVVRSERDDFHLNVTGATALAEVVGQQLRDELRHRGASGVGDGPALNLTGPGTYTIDNNDSLSAIARRTGTTVAAIVAVNGWADQSHTIIPGDDIQLPARAT